MSRSRGADLLQRAFFALLVRPFLVLFIGLRVRGREHLPEAGPFLLIANHQSHLDTLSLLALFPLSQLRRVRPVAAADYFGRNPLVSWFSITFFNILPIVRRREEMSEENDPRQAMLEALAAGDGLLLFPEGTRRSEAADVGHFKAGVAHVIEHHPGLPVVPCHLRNMGRSLPKGALVPVPFFCEVRIGAARVLQGARQAILADLEDAVRRLGMDEA